MLESQFLIGFIAGVVAGAAAWLLRPIIAFVVLVVASAAAAAVSTSGMPGLFAAIEVAAEHVKIFAPFFAALAAGNFVGRVLLAR